MPEDDRKPPDAPAFEALGAAEAARSLEQGQRAKFHSPGGHGFAAEDANAFADRIRGRQVEITGRSNTLNGADRVVDGIPVQTKYHASAQRSVDAAFDQVSGGYRYGGQQLEVPADQYDQAVAVMETRIREGRVKGTSNPADAKKIVRKGTVTYRQARNVARAGTIDSLVYDAKTQAVTTTYVFAISFLVTYARQRWGGQPRADAARSAVEVGLAAGATTFITGVVAAQVLRTRGAALGAVAMRNSLGAVSATTTGRAAVQRVAQASLGRAVYGAAATSHVAKLLRTNVITAAVATAVTSVPDFYRAALARTISWPQFTKNLFVNAGGVGAGTVGFLVGGAIGLSLGPCGSFVLGMGGALVGATIGARAAKAIADGFVEDDATRMIEIVRPVAEELVEDYLLSEPEIERFAEEFKQLVSLRWLRELYRVGRNGDEAAREELVRAHIEPICERMAAGRKRVALPDQQTIEASIGEIVGALPPSQPPPPLPVQGG